MRWSGKRGTIHSASARVNCMYMYENNNKVMVMLLYMLLKSFYEREHEDEIWCGGIESERKKGKRDMVKISTRGIYEARPLA